MDANSLILLAEIIDAGNLSAAAKRLKMSRANVSYHLSKLEKSLNQQLVRRTTRRVEATDVGLRLAEHGRNIGLELAAATDSVSQLGRSLHGRIRLSVPSGFGQMVLASWLLDFKRDYPDVMLDVVFENHVNDILREGIDIAIRVMSNPPLNLVARYLAPVRYTVCASPKFVQEYGMPAKLEELPNFPLITSNVSGRQLRLSAYKDESRQQIMLDPSLASENFAFLHHAILDGLGVGIVPNYVITDDIEKDQLVTALDDYYLSIFGTKMFMLYMPNRYHTRSTATFIEYILKRSREIYGELS